MILHVLCFGYAVFISTEQSEIPETAGPLIAPVAVGVGVGTAIIAVLIVAGVVLVVLALCIL